MPPPPVPAKDSTTPRSFVERVGGSKSVGPGQFTTAITSSVTSTRTPYIRRDRRPSLFDAVDTTEEPVAFEPDVGPTRAPPAPPPAAAVAPAFASGDKGKARDLLAAIRTLHTIEREQRSATAQEQAILAQFPGFGPVALSLFPNPVTGEYKDAGWRVLGEELQALLTPAEYASAKRTTFNAFYTSPTVITAIHSALAHLGVPASARVLEPGCGTGNFLALAPDAMRFIGVELDSISGRIARARHPQHDIRIEDFRESRLPSNLDAVVGNVPFADVKYDYHGQKLALHDYFLAKSLDALRVGGVLAVISSHYTLDKQNASARELLSQQADFLGAIRLPSDAFKTEGTAVVTDILFLRKRDTSEPVHHVDPDWLNTSPLTIDGTTVAINQYFHHHPEMVLGQWSTQDTLYGNGYSVLSNGDLRTQLAAAIQRLPKALTTASDVTEVPSPPTASSFHPPTVAPSVAEGGFMVGADRRIYQRINGELEPVVYGGVALAANGTLVGQRIAALIGLRDAARRVLQSQNEGWPTTERVAARQELNADYDRFVRLYGAINKTMFSETRDGTFVRRMPNLAKFRQDPDAMLVMALEEYDEETGIATKAPILRHDVVGLTPPVKQVSSAEDGLLVSLDQRGVVDLGLISELYGQSQSAIIAELGDLIYRDPATGQWETADAYLSGNVRAKLQAAEQAGPTFARNVEALRAVQPEDVLPGEIDANLGAPWIPTNDIQAFAADLFRVPASSIPVAHLLSDATWSVEANASVQQSVAATTEYGTPRAGGVWLLEQALNLKTPTLYDTITTAGRDERVLNQEATLAAREKQKIIKEKFRQWIFRDPDRSERLVRLYNDTYNNLRPRLFDGSHLAFPGLSQGIELRPHQMDAVWRCMAGGNTLLAHAVGAGKTFTMAAAGMKMKQAGLIRKPMYVVPNHMLDQFSREFLQLYPNAHLLVASQDDLTRDRRKFLTAKIASGDWDGIIVTHSSFEKIGLSRDFQAKFLREQIEEYDQLLVDQARGPGATSHRNIIKTIEKQKARRQEKLKDLLAQDKKDDGLVFDELGVDHLFIDEAHHFKNLETATKMERVAGIQTTGSERAFDLFMKCRYLHGKHAGHGVTFATGTPISNTMVELYTLQRYLDPDGLQSRGIDHFDAWAATFGEVVDAMEIAPDGASLRSRSRFAKFVNLPELQQMFRSFADVQTAPMLNLPAPALTGGKPQIVACPMSDLQAELQGALVARYDKLRSGKVDPRLDNALAITTDGRKLALDARLLSPSAPDFPDSKLNALVDNVTAVWNRTAATKGTQLVFSDLGVHPTAWGFSVYDDIIAKLVARGIPREQVAVVGDADTDAKKLALFDKVRSGSVRILLGSTQKMGAGTNVQKRLVAMHHLDAPWKPAEVEQREGRILRQGNQNSEVAIYRYVTEASFDSYMWQALETKAKFISQLMTGESATRQAEDVAGQELSYAEVKAIASGNPAVLTLAEADAEIQRLSILRKNHADEEFLARRSLRELPHTIARHEARLAALQADAHTAEIHATDPLQLGGRPVPADRVHDSLGHALERLPEQVQRKSRYPLGRYRGLAFGIDRHPDGTTDVYWHGATDHTTMLSRESQGPRAVLNALKRLHDSIPDISDKVRSDLVLSRTQLKDFEARIGIAFPHAAHLEQLLSLRDQLRTALATPATTPSEESSEPQTPDSAAIAAQIKTLLTAKPHSETPTHSPRSFAGKPRPVTDRIRPLTHVPDQAKANAASGVAR